MGVEGNEMADELAKQGANSILIGPEPFCGVPKCSVKRAMSSWEIRRMEQYWTGLPGHDGAKIFMPFYSHKGSKEALKLGRRDLRTLTAMYTGHCDLKLHQFRIGRGSDKWCRFCDEEEESPQHILGECGRLMTKRRRFLGAYILHPHELIWLSPTGILGFMDEIGIRDNP